jgi:MFS family permease
MNEAVASDPAKRGNPNYVLGVLFVVIMLNFLDRQVMAILAEPIKQDMGLTDQQVGLMTGLAFSLFYTTLAVPVAALADRWNRSWIIATAITVWSIMTMLCGAAQNFTQLFLARVGVGIGESANSPPAQSLIAEYFPPERRTFALGIYGSAVPIGAFIASVGGGWLVENFDWRIVFYIAGAPGILVGLIVWLTVKDRRPHGKLLKAFERVEGEATFSEAFKELAQKPAYWHLVAGGTVVAFVAFGISAFYGALYVRIYGLGYAELGLKVGLMIGIAGVLGSWLGGGFGTWLDKKISAGALLASALVFLVAVPATYLSVQVSSANLSFVLLSVLTFATIQALASDRMRAMAVAIFLLVSGIFGIGLGPVFVGTVSDIISGRDPAREAEGITGAIALTGCFSVWSAFHFWRAHRLLGKAAQAGDA